ncbi:3'-5' exonuclease [Vibrio tapetis subsp. quintayensis]|uniref:3'-5' exonuclease n=1 Tax=Vibrio tapetis TaxID=52443 RepID=UPI0025B29B7B|nr:3'-5' exonuclease [Vibrio tapetis]MDN3681752.1 3'-5' exonuclease [Vibrio tapetis subsp. quintayensis]
MKKLFNYFHPLERMKRERKQYVNSVVLPEVLTRLIEQPCPDTFQSADELEYIVLDLETTGLDCNEDRILSIGWVEVAKGKIDLASSRHLYVKDKSQIKPETAVINHITPQMISDAGSIHDAMMTFFEAAEGKVLVAHACVVEANFISSYLKKSYGFSALPLLWLDTMCMEKTLVNAISQQEDVDVTLATTRARYRLPEYNNHNALVDAVSTAELLLAQSKRISPNKPATFGTLYRMSH